MPEPWVNENGSTNVNGWLAAYAEDNNTFWRTEQGHVMNVVDELIDRLDGMKEQWLLAEQEIARQARPPISDRHALYVGWVMGIAMRNGLDVSLVVGEDGRYLDRFHIVLPDERQVIALVVPPPPDDWEYPTRG